MESVHFLNEKQILVFLLQLCVLLGLAKLLGELGRKWGCPPLAGEILTGILLGPTILGRLFPEFQAALFPMDLVHQNMLETVSWLGVFFLLLITGFEVNISSAWKQGKAAIIIGILGVIVPLAIGCAVFWWLPERYFGPNATRLTFTLFLATAASISAISVIARVLHDLGVLQSDVGLTTLSGFVVNDLFGWLIFTVVLGLSAHGEGLGHSATVFVLVIAFGALCLTFGSRFVNAAVIRVDAMDLPQPATTLTLISLLGLLCGAVTQAIGIHAILGFFLAGVMAGNTPAVSERSREIISQMMHAIFVPIFFACIGLRIDFLSHIDLAIMLVFTVVAVGGKLLGAWLAARLAAFRSHEAFAIGMAFIPGGAMEIILGMLALEMKLIAQTTFVAIVFAALLSSIAVGPLYAWALGRRPQLDIGTFLQPGSICTDLKSGDRWQAIPELCEHLPAYLRDRRREIIDAVIAREELMGTGFEQAIAFPHARIKGLREPVIIFGRSHNGVEWDCRDGHEVKYAFLILTADAQPEYQVPILAAIVRMMIDDDIRYQIFGATHRKEIYAVLKNALKGAGSEVPAPRPEGLAQ
jgi:Kef-type K+ transport system membrane component KefB/mannitol/fructose-specific phosphotransferase system IIA component (Ntr-type)